jgi:hypothetical protein
MLMPLWQNILADTRGLLFMQLLIHVGLYLRLHMYGRLSVALNTDTHTLSLTHTHTHTHTTCGGGLQGRRGKETTTDFATRTQQ